jgi:hypothetical protein
VVHAPAVNVSAQHPRSRWMIALCSFVRRCAMVRASRTHLRTERAARHSQSTNAGEKGPEHMMGSRVHQVHEVMGQHLLVKRVLKRYTSGYRRSAAR